MEIDPNIEAEIRGHRDFYADYRMSDNPYPKETELHKRWRTGFISAQHGTKIETE